MNTARNKKEWSLTSTAFERLLAWLDPDREQAGRKYEEIRRKLLKFFEWQGCAYPEEQTDQTINRVARRLDEGVKILASNPFIYFSGVARNVLKEYQRHPERGVLDLAVGQYASKAPERGSEAREMDLECKLECLECCLQRLSSSQRELITEYYCEEKQAKIKTRKRLATRLEISLNTLRIRSYRIKESLEKCITDCLSRAPGSLK